MLTHVTNLIGKAVAATLVFAGAMAAGAQTLPVMVGQDRDAAVAALKAKGISFQEDAGKTISYQKAGESVTLDLAAWPKSPTAPAAAWDAGTSAERHLVVAHILDVAPGSDARRAWVRTFERDGKHWAYLSEKASSARPDSARSQYPVVALLQLPPPSGGWPATLLFQAARPAGTPPAGETTALEIFLDNPHHPRQF